VFGSVRTQTVRRLSCSIRAFATSRRGRLERVQRVLRRVDVAAVIDGLAPQLVGQDPRRVEAICIDAW
jgi:hypothetical protein